jgi:hypothetical protein
MSMRAEQTLKSAKNQAARGGVASRLDWLEDAGRRARDRHGSAVQQALLVQMRGQCTALSMHKYSSNVVEEALSLCTKAALVEAVEAETRPASAGPAGGSAHRNGSAGRGNGESKGGQTSTAAATANRGKAAEAAEAAASVVASAVGHEGETYVFSTEPDFHADLKIRIDAWAEGYRDASFRFHSETGDRAEPGKGGGKGEGVVKEGGGMGVPAMPWIDLLAR